jgi:hypothetical protein
MMGVLVGSTENRVARKFGMLRVRLLAGARRMPSQGLPKIVEQCKGNRRKNASAKVQTKRARFG